jgi:hypothetical protein
MKMSEFSTPTVQSATPATSSESGVTATPEEGGAQEARDAAQLLELAREMDAEKPPSASDQAFGAQQPHVAKKNEPHTPQDGAFTGFGAEFNPYAWTNPHLNHNKLERQMQQLHDQHVRMIIPGAVIATGMLGKAGTPNYNKQALDNLKHKQSQDPTNAELKKQLEEAEKSYAADVKAVESFEKTMAMAGKHTTINLTYCGATGQPHHVDLFAAVVRYLYGEGYTGLQLTLENEPNGPDQGTGFRGRFNKGEKTGNKAEAREAVQEYVDAYKELDTDLHDKTAKGGDIRDNVKIVGGDMVGNRRTQFFELITKLGLNKYVDAYSFHIYFGAGQKHSLEQTLKNLMAVKKLAAHLAPDKALQITEFGSEHFSTAADKAHNGGLGVEANEKGPANAFQQALFALSAVNDGFSSVVKWDAFYAFTPDRHVEVDPKTHKPVINPKTGKPKIDGDPRGNFGHFSMIDSHQQEDAAFRLMSMFTHAVDPGWHVHGTNHGLGGAQATFKSPDGKDGAILVLSQGGTSVSTAGLPHRPLHVTTWNGDGKGGLARHSVAHGESVAVPATGAVAVSTLG